MFAPPDLFETDHDFLDFHRSENIHDVIDRILKIFVRIPGLSVAYFDGSPDPFEFGK